MSKAINEAQVFGVSQEPRRPLLAAIGRGLAGRCPSCRRGELFSGFAATVHACAVCGEEIHHHRADDFPAYVNIFITGHVVVGGFLLAERITDWSSWTHLAIWVPLTLLMAVVTIRPIKGAVIGLQWANRMHGFGGESDGVADPDIDPAAHG